jgi:4-hydroxy-2-oxoheptanedioate aldolase
MSAPENPFKTALRQGRPQIGLWQSLAYGYSAEICAGAGFDWLLFDGEHGPNDLPALLAQLQAVAAYPVHAVGRPPVGETWLIKQYLDIGFTSLLIPLVESGAQARELVRAVRYPPTGVRGVASARAARWGRTKGYLQSADAGICLLLQVETPLGLQNLAEIAATEGVDGVFIGPSDLSAGLGHPGDPGHPEVQAAIEQAMRTVLACGKACGVLTPDEGLARRYLELGCTFVAVGGDIGLLVAATNALAARFKGDRAASAISTGY